ncbi:MAG: heme exporter protein CcmB [Acidobacteriota bacterium]|jgi:heme exporter protein B|nr:heme exporter protein CcmB [Acidobacteriota bacterium]NLT33259.1 ABC transporter permease [Acidobacteriota bacterium]
MTRLWAVFRKDLAIELRTKDALNTMLFFGVVVLVVFHFALRSGDVDPRAAAPGVLWVAFAFAGTLGLNRMFAVEKENGCLEGLMMMPADRGVLYLGKMLAGTVFMLAAEAVIFVASLVFFNLTVWGELPWLGLVFLLGTLGFTAVGTLLAAIAVNTRMREVLLPVILFPVILPVLIHAVEATALILGGAGPGELKLPVAVLAAFTVVFGTIAFLLFEHVLED